MHRGLIGIFQGDLGLYRIVSAHFDQCSRGSKLIWGFFKPFLAIVGCFGPFQGQIGSLWDRFKPFWAAQDHFKPCQSQVCLFRDHFKPFQAIFCSFAAVMGRF